MTGKNRGIDIGVRRVRADLRRSQVGPVGPNRREERDRIADERCRLPSTRIVVPLDVDRMRGRHRDRISQSPTVDQPNDRVVSVALRIGAGAGEREVQDIRDPRDVRASPGEQLPHVHIDHVDVQLLTALIPLVVGQREDVLTLGDGR